MHHITFFCCDQMLATSLTLPIEMMRAGENAAQVQNRDSVSLQIVSAGLSKNKVQTAAGFSFEPDFTLEEIKHTDILFLPALWRNPKASLRQNPQLIEWIQRLHQQGTLICSVGIGVSFLAETGLLDGKPATTHWYYFDRFQKDYPQIQLKRQHFIVQSGNLYSAASVNSLADLTVYFLQRLYNKLVAMHVERHFSHEVRKAYSATSFVNEHSQHPDEDIIQVQVWLQKNYHETISMADLAKTFEFSLRTLNRRFKAATGSTPLNYLQQLRMDGAKDLLKNTNLSIYDVANKVGYNDLSHFNRLFKRLLATSPTRYREMVRAKLFSTE